MHAASDSAVEHSLEGGAVLFLERKMGILPKTTGDIFPKVGILPKTQVAYFNGRE